MLTPTRRGFFQVAFSLLAAIYAPVSTAGHVDEARITEFTRFGRYAMWDTALSENEFWALCNGAPPVLIRPGNLKVYLRGIPPGIAREEQAT